MRICGMTDADRLDCMKQHEALAATDDLDGLILCHAEPFGFNESCGSDGANALDELLQRYARHAMMKPLYRAWEPEMSHATLKHIMARIEFATKESPIAVFTFGVPRQAECGIRSDDPHEATNRQWRQDLHRHIRQVFRYRCSREET